MSVKAQTLSIFSPLSFSSWPLWNVKWLHRFHHRTEREKGTRGQ